MSCKRESKTNKGEESLLFDILYTIANEDEATADQYFARFSDDIFLEDFGDYIKDASKQVSERTLDQRRVDENGEPRLMFDPKLQSYFYINKNGIKKIYNPENTFLSDFFDETFIREITKALAFNFLKNRIDGDFNELDLNKERGSLSSSIRKKLEDKIAEFSESDLQRDMFNSIFLNNTLPILGQWVSSVEAYFQEMKLVYKETSDQEDALEEEESERGGPARIASFEKSVKENVSANVKLRLSLLVDIDSIDGVFQEPTFLEFDEVFGTLLQHFTDQVAIREAGNMEDMFKIYLKELQGLTVKKPYFKDLHAMLSRPTLPDYIKSEFVQAFNLHKNNFIGTIYNIKKVRIFSEALQEFEESYATTSYVINLSDVGAKSRFIKSNWDYTLLTRIFGKDHGKLSVGEMSKYAQKFKQGILNSTVEFKQLENKGIMTESHFATQVEKVKNTLSSFGIITTEKGFNHYLDGSNALPQSLQVRAKNLIKLSDSLNYFIESMIQGNLNPVNKSPMDSQVELGKLANAEAFYITHSSDASIFTVGKTKWIYSYPSYLSTRIKYWKKNKEALRTHYMSTELTRSSHYMKYLLGLDADYVDADEIADQRLDEFELAVFNSVQQKGGQSVDNKTVSKNDAFADIFNKMLGFRKEDKSYVMTPAPADKGTQYQFGIPSALMVDSNARWKNGQVVINDSTIQILFSHIQAEHERIKRTQREIEDAEESEDLSTLITHYHLGNQNGLKFQLFPSMNNQDNGLWNADGTINKDIDLNIESQKATIEKLIADVVDQDVQGLIKKLRRMQMVNIDTNKNYSNRGFDKAIWDSYNGSATPIIAIATDIYINGLISQIEYTKMFSGDIAYYKDAVDYKKRIPGTYTDGLQLYLTESDPVTYNAAVIQGVNIPEPYLNELKKLVPESIWSKYTDINSTDAQAWITPKRWRFLREKLGKWHPTDEAIYQKLIGKDNTPWNEKQLKRAAQPLKGVYFEMNENRPVYLKYSQAVLLPELIQGTALESIAQKMEQYDIDELITIDGVKVGAFNPTLTHNPDGSVIEDFVLTPMPLKNSGWKLQQDLPTKTFKDTDVGSQIQKIIFSGLANNKTELFQVGDQEMVGADLIDRIHLIVEKLSDAGFFNLEREFGIDPSGKITNIERLNQTIISELKSRGTSYDVIQALENGASPFAIPGYQEKIQNVFASMVLKRVVKIQTNGGAFIQMSNYGLNQSEANKKGIIWTPWAKETTHTYEELTDPEGNVLKSASGKTLIRPAGIMIPASFIAKYVPDWKKYRNSPELLFGKYNKKTNTYSGGLIDYEILNNIIGYRTPNQGLSSNDALQVVGILPEGVGDTIVAYTGITTKTGSDFDIDKMFLMMPSFLPRRRNASKLRKYANTALKGKDIDETIDNISKIVNQLDPEDEIVKFDGNRLAKIIFSEDSIEVKNFELDNFIEAILTSNSELSKYIKEQVPGFDQVDNLRYVKPPEDLETANVRELQNALIESYKGVLLNDKVLPSVVTPLDFTFFKDDIKSMFKPEPPKDLSSFNILDEVELRYQFMAGKAGVGQTANALVDHVRGQLSNLRMAQYYLGEGHMNELGETIFDQEYSVELTDEEILDYAQATGKSIEEVEKLRKIKVADSLSALMNAFVDIAKDPYITRGNWTTETANVGFMMLRAGIHPFQVNAFLAQPILKEYTEFSTNEQSIIVESSGDITENFIEDKILNRLQNLPEGQASVTINNITKNKALVYAAMPITSRKPTRLYRLFNVEEGSPEIQQFIEEIKGLENEYKAVESPQLPSIRTLKDQLEEDTPQAQMNVFYYFKELVGKAKDLTDNINASKSDVTGYGKNQTQLVTMFNLVNQLIETELEEKEGRLSGFSSKLKFNGKKTVLGTYLSNSVMKIKQIMQQNPLLFLSVTPSVINSFNDVSQGIYGHALTSGVLADKLHKAFYTHVMSGFGPLQMDPEERYKMINDFPEEFEAFQKTSKNFFVNELDVRSGVNRPYIVMSNKIKSPTVQTNLTNAWANLLDEHPEMANKLIKYSFATSGFEMNMYQFFSYIPTKWFVQNKIDEYISEVGHELASKDVIDDQFVKTFFRHNMEDSSVVPYVFRNQIKTFGANPIGGIIVKAKKNKHSPRFVKLELSSEFDEPGQPKKFALYELEGFDAELDPVYIRQVALGYKDSKGHRIVEVERGNTLTPTGVPQNFVRGLGENNREVVRSFITVPRNAAPYDVPEDNFVDAVLSEQVVLEKGNLDLPSINKLPMPLLKVPPTSALEISRADNPFFAKQQYKELQRETNELDKLIKCLWMI